MASESITIRPVAGKYDLHAQYPRQSGPQDVYIWLDCRTRTCGAEYNAEIGNAIPFAVYHGHVRRYSIPILTAEAANTLMTELAPAFAVICDGYSSHWDGNNTVGTLTEEAQEAETDMEADLERRPWDESELVNAWDAAEWLGGTGGDQVIRQEIREHGGPECSDAYLSELVARFQADAEEDGVHLVGNVLEYLQGLRDDLREEAE